MGEAKKEEQARQELVDLGASTTKTSRGTIYTAVISHFAYIFASQDFADARSFIPFYYGGILNMLLVLAMWMNW